MGVFVTGSGKLVSRQGVKHEGIVGIRRMRKLNFHRLFFGARRWLGSRHGVITSFSFGDERPVASVPSLETAKRHVALIQGPVRERTLALAGTYAP